MTDSEWVRFMQELATPGRYEHVESEVVFMAVSEMFGVRITVLNDEAPHAPALSYCFSGSFARLPEVVIVWHRLNNPTRAPHYDAAMKKSWASSCESDEDGLPPFPSAYLGEPQVMASDCVCEAPAEIPSEMPTECCTEPVFDEEDAPFCLTSMSADIRHGDALRSPPRHARHETWWTCLPQL